MLLARGSLCSFCCGQSVLLLIVLPFLDTMRDLLSLLPKPSHYAGCEPGAVHKNPDRVTVRLALAFPDLYEIGMSYTGQTILYNVINQRPAWWAERVYAPTREAAAVLQERGVSLVTLESGTPLARLDVLGFHLTHELCYTNVLFMLDLAGIPFRASERGEGWPLVIAGGGCTLNAEPIASFLDLMVLGDGEEALPEILERLEAAQNAGQSRLELLLELSRLPGVYVPALFADTKLGPPTPLVPGYKRVERRVLADLDTVSYPTGQPQAFGAIHDHYTLEIARGCTRGCRFCQAGMIYRPVRERSLATIDRILDDGLKATGYAGLSFLALSVGDFSALAELIHQSASRCAAEQVAIALSSLRVGSVGPEVMATIAAIRRTGMTIAPEAGSQRLRDVINKGVTEEGLLAHVAHLFGYGWSSVKLYFMIGLPTETDADLEAIVDLCCKVEATARVAATAKRAVQVTVSVSPFVPKPHTPFQWEEQVGLVEIRRRLRILQRLFKPYRRIKMRWHMPEMSFLEGIFSRGDRALAPVVEAAYHKGALFVSWADSFSLDPWLEAMAEQGLDPVDYLAIRDQEGPLPWDHLVGGVSQSFLRTERRRALAGRLTTDCRFGDCSGCGVCTALGQATELTQQHEQDIRPRCNLSGRDQTEYSPTNILPEAVCLSLPAGREVLGYKADRYRLWYTKCGPAVALSQLELQAVFERAFRRARLPLAFSQGYHPLPLISFSRALPVGVGSLAEHLEFCLRESMEPEALETALDKRFLAGMELIRLERLPLAGKTPLIEAEEYQLIWHNSATLEAFHAAWAAFATEEQWWWTRITSKRTCIYNIRPIFLEIDRSHDDRLRLVFCWRERYLNPLALVCAVLPKADPSNFLLLKIRPI
ncbi:Radical SAM superfamily protein [Desulfovibrionales bacterium]